MKAIVNVSSRPARRIDPIASPAACYTRTFRIPRPPALRANARSAPTLARNRPERPLSTLALVPRSSVQSLVVHRSVHCPSDAAADPTFRISALSVFRVTPDAALLSVSAALLCAAHALRTSVRAHLGAFVRRTSRLSASRADHGAVPTVGVERAGRTSQPVPAHGHCALPRAAERANRSRHSRSHSRRSHSAGSARDGGRRRRLAAQSVHGPRPSGRHAVLPRRGALATTCQALHGHGARGPARADLRSPACHCESLRRRRNALNRLRWVCCDQCSRCSSSASTCQIR